MLEIYYQNVRGLRTKQDELSKNILQSSYGIIALTETWLNSSVLDGGIIDPRYTVYRRDRCFHTAKSKEDGGGVLLAVSNNIKSDRISLWETEQETLWVLLQVTINHQVKKIAVCVVYLPPPVSKHALKKFLESVRIVMMEKFEILIMGDFNLGPSIQHGTTANDTSLCVRYANIRTCFNNFISANKLSQLNWLYNCDKRLLDLIITNVAHIQVEKSNNNLCKVDKQHPNLVIKLNR